ncbi:/ ydfG_1 / NADP-dependent 3-hydroxy acid dehydrogenase YdfG /:248358 Reverse [Candidatus Hepatoplasma crinochetorum]|uniref:/ ydfG_1 / NADP-dependent 3-hydroxy acid dehydrogenase YdfG /:248358 Reverse n=1 Tax=Candidatus Hepatoplasma crinochetorum TaxID=295596 RepID=A0A0G7ZMP6_9MOLU|nr:/ ydfG_1 / NADP-dependent 3-hydroxy acid dehydrogenase YdfG /:248358 Reverse [Candidatus Hepatoplasma crinochetorum]
MRYITVTGASSGIGKAIATYFAEKGHNIIIVARRKELLENLKNDLEKKYQIKVIVFIYDLAITENVYKFYQDIKKYDVELLVNNAGFGDINNPWDSNLEKINKMIDLNIKALTDLTILFIKDNLNKEAQIINVSSAVGYFILPTGISYSASKFYVSTFTEGISRFLKKQNAKIKVKILAPAATESEFLIRAYNKSKIDKEAQEKSKERVKQTAKTSEDLAYFAYQLYQSDRVIGIVNPFTNKFKLKNKWFDLLE